MTKEFLEEYRSKKEEIGELQYKLRHMYNEDADAMIGNDTILNYNKGYPIPQAVVGVDWNKIVRTEKRYEKRIEILTKECVEVEQWIENIPDSLLRRIFRMYYIDKMTQRQIANKVHMDQSSVTRKIDNFLKVASNTSNASL